MLRCRRPNSGPGTCSPRCSCVQPNVTEAQLASGIPTLAFERIKKRLAAEAPVQLFGHEFCVRPLEVGEGVTRVRSGDSRGSASKAPLRGSPLCDSYATRADLTSYAKDPSLASNFLVASLSMRCCRDCAQLWTTKSPIMRWLASSP